MFFKLKVNSHQNATKLFSNQINEFICYNFHKKIIMKLQTALDLLNNKKIYFNTESQEFRTEDYEARLWHRLHKVALSSFDALKELTPSSAAFLQQLESAFFNPKDMEPPVVPRYFNLGNFREKLHYPIPSHMDWICESQKFIHKLEALEAPHLLKTASKLRLAVNRFKQARPILTHRSPEFLRADRRFALNSMTHDDESYQYVSETLKHDKAFSLAASRINFDIELMPAEIIHDHDVAVQILSTCVYQFHHLPTSLKNSKAFALRALNNGLKIYNLLGSELKDDRDIIIASIHSNPSSYGSIPKVLREDLEIATLACQKLGSVISYAHSSLKANKALALIALENSGVAYNFLAKELKDDVDIIMAACKQNHSILANVTLKDFHKNAPLMLNLIRHNHESFLFTDDSLKKERGFILVALQTNPYVVEHLENVENDAEIAHLVLSLNGNLLHHFDESITESLPHLIQAFLSSPYDTTCFLRDKGKSQAFIDLVVSEALGSLAIPSHIFKILSSHKRSSTRDFLLKALFYAARQGRFLELGIDPDSKPSLSTLVIILMRLGMIQLEAPKELITDLSSNIDFFKVEFKAGDKLQALIDCMQMVYESPLSKELKWHLMSQSLIKSSDPLLRKETFKEIIQRLQLLKIASCELAEKEIKELPNLESRTLKLALLNTLIEHRFLKYEDIDLFCETFLKSRDPTALFTYAKQFICNYEMKEWIQVFIDTVCKKTFLSYRRLHNSHLDCLTPTQIEAWDQGGSTSIYMHSEKDHDSFDLYQFLKQKLLIDNHDVHPELAKEGALKNIKRLLSGDEIDRSTLNELENHVLELMECSKESFYEKVQDLLKIFKKSEFENLEFKNDVLALAKMCEKTIDTRTFHLKDSDDWEDLFLCGTEVMGSCQRVDGDRELNQCLLGYCLDGKTRILTLKTDPSGKMIARAIFKIMIQTRIDPVSLDEYEVPCLFMEGVYPGTHSDHNQMLFEFAKERAKSIGLELYQAGGREKLFSKGVNALCEYEDADPLELASGVTQGSYSIMAQKIELD
jgi:Domain of unknown function (DUF4116)